MVLSIPWMMGEVSMAHGLGLNLIWKCNLQKVVFHLSLLTNMVILFTLYLIPKLEKRTGFGLNEFTS